MSMHPSYCDGHVVHKEKGGDAPFGLLLWNQTRQQWIGNRRSENQIQQVCRPRIRYLTYNNLLSTNMPFPRPIPLADHNIDGDTEIRSGVTQNCFLI
ncbi:hypothetical protein HHK36_021456 [Tetracentron sinense]|uniref:DUF4050 domain-containing protein n=1 Tax=Tetracentron sinense TaxID=13715 RepID=A0A834YS64_TETSI|nr:hypothetical protein HHK36_021456 [Tetracentron sinense]